MKIAVDRLLTKCYSVLFFLHAANIREIDNCEVTTRTFQMSFRDYHEVKSMCDGKCDYLNYIYETNV